MYIPALSVNTGGTDDGMARERRKERTSNPQTSAAK
jgi:hypothetical protein